MVAPEGLRRRDLPALSYSSSVTNVGVYYEPDVGSPPSRRMRTASRWIWKPYPGTYRLCCRLADKNGNLTNSSCWARHYSVAMKYQRRGQTLESDRRLGRGDAGQQRPPEPEPVATYI